MQRFLSELEWQFELALYTKQKVDRNEKMDEDPDEYKYGLFVMGLQIQNRIDRSESVYGQF